LNAVGSIVRLLTVLVESDNFYYNLQFIVGAALNNTLLMQFFLYWNNAPKKAEAKTDAKKETKKDK